MYYSKVVILNHTANLLLWLEKIILLILKSRSVVWDKDVGFYNFVFYRDRKKARLISLNDK